MGGIKIKREKRTERKREMKDKGICRSVRTVKDWVRWEFDSVGLRYKSLWYLL